MVFLSYLGCTQSPLIICEFMFLYDLAKGHFLSSFEWVMGIFDGYQHIKLIFLFCISGEIQYLQVHPPEVWVCGHTIILPEKKSMVPAIWNTIRDSLQQSLGLLAWYKRDAMGSVIAPHPVSGIARDFTKCDNNSLR